MSIGYNHLQVRVRPSVVAQNYSLMRQHCPNAWAVIKSDAYGHGLVPVAKALLDVGAKTFAVGTVDEALELRGAGVEAEIVSLLGPVLNGDYKKAVSAQVLCFCARPEQLRKLSEVALEQEARAQVAVKFDTGMRRLGFRPGQAREVADLVAMLPGLDVSAAASHLAVADVPDQEAFVRQQSQEFLEAVSILRENGLMIRASLANSAAILAYPELHLDAVRPGIALYGGNPFVGTARQELGAGLRQAMDVTTRIYQVHDLGEGETISYGRTFTAPRDMRVAIVGVGYADNYSRGLSNKGQVLVHGRRAPVVGRVCMQMSAVDVTDIPEARAADEVWLLGGEGDNAISADELASWWGTISYEVLCLLGMNPRTVLDSQGQNG